MGEEGHGRSYNVVDDDEHSILKCPFTSYRVCLLSCLLQVLIVLLPEMGILCKEVQGKEVPI